LVGFNDATQKKVAELEAKLLGANGKERLKIQLQILDAQRLQELNNVNLTEQQKADIIKRYDQLSGNLRLQRGIAIAYFFCYVG